MFASAQLEAISARFFDVSSCYNGTVCLSSADAASIPPKDISIQLKKRLNNIATNINNQALKKSILSAKFKWEFVEDGVVNYSDKSAHFVVYATKNKISKLLKNSQRKLAAL